MEPEALVFQLLNVSVLPWWALWLVAPRSAPASVFAAPAGVFIALAVLYAALLGAAIVSGELRALQALQGLDAASVRAGLSSPLGFLAGWTHFLAFDLFCGAWIVREARRLALEPRPYLVFALLAGPIGLGGFLVRRALHLRSLGRLGEVDLA